MLIGIGVSGALAVIAGVVGLLFAGVWFVVALVRRRPLGRPLRVALAMVALTFAGGGLFGVAVAYTPASGPPTMTRPLRDLLMTAADFPFPAYTVGADTDPSNGTVRRQFSAPAVGDPQYGNVVMYLLPRGSVGWVNGRTCSWQSERPPATLVRIPAPPSGEAAYACRYRWADGTRWYELTSTARGVGIQVSVYVPMPQMVTEGATGTQATTPANAPSSPAAPQASARLPDDREAMTFLSRIVERQIALFDRAEHSDGLALQPPGDALGGRLDEPFRFDPPSSLPAAAIGEPYRYSFCEPERARPGDPCGGSTEVLSPSGGTPPYRFRYARSGAFPPFGLVLGESGELSGSADGHRGQGTTSFGLCAVDAKDKVVCRTVSIGVKVAP